jgi:hypothetical protein
VLVDALYIKIVSRYDRLSLQETQSYRS